MKPYKISHADIDGMPDASTEAEASPIECANCGGHAGPSDLNTHWFKTGKYILCPDCGRPHLRSKKNHERWMRQIRRRRS